MNKSTIEWTDRTWNPVSGCTKVSQGCKFCYAERNAHRWGKDFSKIVLNEHKLNEPLKIKTPQRIFVNSMSDLFHKDVPDSFIDKVFAIMNLSRQHTFQILTKRPERMLDYLWTINRKDKIFDAVGKMGISFKEDVNLYENIKVALPNIWLGVSCEDQQTADKRIPLLIQAPAAVRFLSCEPLLGPIDLGAAPYREKRLITGINWVIAGGESGPGARPMHPDWVRTIRNQCEGAGVPFFFKQWGEWYPINCSYAAIPTGNKNGYRHKDGYKYEFYTDDIVLKDRIINSDNIYTVPNICDMAKVGKKAAGNHLDGKQHLEFPNPITNG